MCFLRVDELARLYWAQGSYLEADDSEEDNLDS